MRTGSAEALVVFSDCSFVHPGDVFTRRFSVEQKNGLGSTDLQRFFRRVLFAAHLQKMLAKTKEPQSLTSRLILRRPCTIRVDYAYSDLVYVTLLLHVHVRLALLGRFYVPSPIDEHD